MSRHDCDLEGAWEASRLLLDAAGLRTYLFRVEVEDDQVAIHVEHPSNGAWQHTSVRAPLEELLRTLDDRKRRTALAAHVGGQLLTPVAA